MPVYHIDNYIIEEDPVNILYHIRDILNNGKLRDIIIKKDELVVTCPNDEHDLGQESNPDCHINLKDDGDIPYLCTNCFACGSSGNFIKFVAQCFSSTYSYAKDWLIKNYGIMAYAKASIGEKINLNKNKKKVYSDASALEKLQDWHPYLAERHLDRAICEKFKVKYDPVHRQIVFPVFDVKGNLLMAPRRNIDNKFFILGKDQEKPLYGFNVIQKNNVKYCLWVEGPIDMLSCWSHGIPAVASLGAPSEEQIEQINSSCVTTLYLACDNDSAGRTFNLEIKKRLSSRIIVYEIDYPAGKKDPNDLTEDDWENLIKKYQLSKVF